MARTGLPSDSGDSLRRLINCAARTTLSPSVGPRHLYLAGVRLCLETPYSFSWLNKARTISQRSHVSRTWMCRFDGVGSHFGRNRVRIFAERPSSDCSRGTDLNAIGLIAFTSACGAAVLFMLVFLRAFVRGEKAPQSHPQRRES